MTPAERARQIDKEEFAAESAAIRQRAYDWLAKQRPSVKSKPEMRGRAMVYTALGHSRTLKEWAEASGIRMGVISQRIHCYNWNIEQAVTQPVGSARLNRAGRKYVVNGVARSVNEWAKDAGVSRHVIYERLAAGWPVEVALTLPKGSSRPASDKPGVPSNFAPSKGTGAGSTAQETPNITFSGIDA